MTREIALHCMKSYSELHSDLCELCPIYGQTGSDHCFEDALQYVIGMLEQEPILNKLRAEIETKYGQCKLCEFDSDYDGVYTDIGDIADILQILDKYKAESEDGMCKDCHYNDGEVHAECVICDKAESENKK